MRMLGKLPTSGLDGQCLHVRCHYPSVLFCSQARGAFPAQRCDNPTGISANSARNCVVLQLVDICCPITEIEVYAALYCKVDGPWANGSQASGYKNVCSLETLSALRLSRDY